MAFRERQRKKEREGEELWTGRGKHTRRHTHTNTHTHTLSTALGVVVAAAVMVRARPRSRSHSVTTQREEETRAHIGCTGQAARAHGPTKGGLFTVLTVQNTPALPGLKAQQVMGIERQQKPMGIYCRVKIEVIYNRQSFIMISMRFKMRFLIFKKYYFWV